MVSSSSAVTVATGNAVNALFELGIAPDMLVHLACSAESIHQRIRTNVGGDRAGRQDDDLAAVQKRLAIFTARTAPLVDHYRRQNVAIETIEIGATTTAEDVRRILVARWAGRPVEDSNHVENPGCRTATH